jgi:hypothetical protein
MKAMKPTEIKVGETYVSRDDNLSLPRTVMAITTERLVVIYDTDRKTMTFCRLSTFARWAGAVAK